MNGDENEKSAVKSRWIGVFERPSTWQARARFANSDFNMGDFILGAISLSSHINVENVTQYRQLSEIVALKLYYPW